VAGAIGTALFVTIMTAGQQNHLAGIANPGAADESTALTAGVKLAFSFGLLLAVAAFVLSFFVKRVNVTPGQDPAQEH
jgi:MFS transporter, DHA2 family, lincomycin resistance protein